MSVLVLASTSAVRLQLLRSAGVECETAAPEVDERTLTARLQSQGAGPEQIASALAAAKAEAVSKLSRALVIGADQTLEFDGQLFTKPDTLEEARNQLMRLRGGRHRLHSAVAAARGGRTEWRTLDSATLWVRGFSDTFLTSYLAREGPVILGCVGGYRLEGLGAQLFERTEGDYFTILGLPLIPLLSQLRSTGHLGT